MEQNTEALRLNLGAGAMRIEGWLSVGLEDHHDIRQDLTKPLQILAHADDIMAIHVFEHFQRWEAPGILADWHSCLKPGGKLVLEMPELLRCCRSVLDNPDPRRGIWGLFGDPGYKDPLMVHKWCYSEPEIAGLLMDAGFRKPRFTTPQFHGRKTLRDMRVECIK